MGYTIKQVAEKLQLTVYTLRYYEKEGLLPVVERDCHGNRIFTDSDVEWGMLICCLRETGMPIGEIKRYVELCQQGDDTMQVRQQMIVQHKRTVEQKIQQMNKYLDKINRKLGYYDNLIKGKAFDCCKMPLHSKTSEAK